jgi:Predicted hydrolase (metallo-beta-lactamase superfamily)
VKKVAYTVRISFLNVNQGMAGVVEIYDGLIGTMPVPPIPAAGGALVPALPVGASLVGIMLVDFGCQGSAGMANDFSVQYVQQLMALRGMNVIDAVSISHLDDDHYSLLRHLGAGTVIEDLFIGGEDANRNNIGILLGQLAAGGITFNNIFHQFNGYAENGPDPYLNEDGVWVLGNQDNVCFKILLANAQNLYNPPPRRAADFINTGSIMLLLYSFQLNGNVRMIESSFLFTGDATTKTLMLFNGLPFANNFLGEPKGMSVPHHGSDSSIRSRGGNYTDLTNLLTRYQPATAVVSAGYHMGYKHPGKYSMYYFREALRNPGGPFQIPAPAVLPDSVPPPAASTHVNSIYQGTGSRARIRMNGGNGYIRIQNSNFYPIEEMVNLYNTSTAWGTPFARRNVHIDFNSVNQGSYTITWNEF